MAVAGHCWCLVEGLGGSRGDGLGWAHLQLPEAASHVQSGAAKDCQHLGQPRRLPLRVALCHGYHHRFPPERGPVGQVFVAAPDQPVEDGFDLAVAITMVVYPQTGDAAGPVVTDLLVEAEAFFGDGDCEIEPIFDRLIWSSDE